MRVKEFVSPRHQRVRQDRRRIYFQVRDLLPDWRMNFFLDLQLDLELRESSFSAFKALYKLYDLLLAIGLVDRSKTIMVR